MTGQLDADQLKAVQAPIPSALVVEAAPGSGKTRTLTHRVAYMVSQGVPPESIFCATFTNQAADEMRNRLVGLVGEQAASQMAIGTLHAISAQILREMAGMRFSIYDEHDQFRVASRVLASMGGVPGLDPGKLVEIIARAKANLQKPSDLRRSSPSLASAFQAYEAILRASGALDFEDLIQVLVDRMRDPSFRARVNLRYAHILVDEAQDLSRSQIELVLALLRPRSPSLFAVADPRQSIYAWRSALPTGVREMVRRVPGCKVAYLPTNYRSTRSIVDAACRLFDPPVPMVTPREQGVPVVHRRFASDLQEAAFVARHIRHLLGAGVPAGEIAVLVRVRSLVPVLEQALVEHAVPYFLVGGTPLLARSEIKALLAYARLASNPRDLVALERALGFPPKGIGEVSQAKILGEVSRGKTLGQLATSPPPGLRKAVLPALRDLDQLIARLASKTQHSPYQFLFELLQDLRLLGPAGAHVLGEEGTRLVARLSQAALRFSKEHPEATIGDFVEYAHFLTMDDPPPCDRVVLSTIHAAKGREWRVVFVVGLEDGILPISHHREEYEEERRVLYVGMTRAKDQLILTSARRRRSQPRRILELSPFVRELTARRVVLST